MKISEIQKTLQDLLVGEVLENKQILEFYSVDSSSYQILPTVVVIPKTLKDIISVVKFANIHKISVTVRGAGTGLVGNSLNFGIIIDLKNFDSISIQRNYVKVGPGVIKGNLDKELKKNKKFFAPNPSIGPYCTIGGMIGNNASGSKTMKYGSTIDNLKEITFVDGKGNKVKLPNDQKISKKIFDISKKINYSKFPKTSKNSCGYRLDCVDSMKNTHKILAGAEGTLGIIVEAKLYIKDIPKNKILFVVEYQSIYEAVKDCIKLRNSIPSSLEFVDNKTLENFNYDFENNPKCLLFVEYDSDLNQKEKDFLKLISGNVIKKIKKEKDIERWWKFRDLALTYSLKSIKNSKRVPHIIEDAAVPLQNLGKLFLLIEEINKKFHTKGIMYGHAGNGNIHVRIISSRKKIEVLDKIAEKYFDGVIKLGGTITAEHGDGIARSNFVKKQYGDRNYRLFKDLKKLTDPKNILNPGKVSNYDRNLKKLENY